jgi:hypothetical protein
MKRREETRARNQAAQFMEVNGLGPDSFNGSHHFRIPSPLMSDGLFKLQKKCEGADVFRYYGIMLGENWHHDDWELETIRTDDRMAYGAAVFEELHNAGYRLEWMCLMVTLLTREMNDAAGFSQEVLDRLGFSKASGGDGAPSNSKPPGMPTATSTVSMA